LKNFSANLGLPVVHLGEATFLAGAAETASAACKGHAMGKHRSNMANAIEKLWVAISFFAAWFSPNPSVIPIPTLQACLPITMTLCTTVWAYHCPVNELQGEKGTSRQQELRLRLRQTQQSFTTTSVYIPGNPRVAASLLAYNFRSSVADSCFSSYMFSTLP
jgi:hypothetical protein